MHRTATYAAIIDERWQELPIALLQHVNIPQIFMIQKHVLKHLRRVKESIFHLHDVKLSSAWFPDKE